MAQKLLSHDTEHRIMMAVLKFALLFTLLCYVTKPEVTTGQSELYRDNLRPTGGNDKEPRIKIKDDVNASTIVPQQLRLGSSNEHSQFTLGEYPRGPVDVTDRNDTDNRPTATAPPQQPHDRLDLPHTAGSLQALLQRINDRLTTLEALENRQLRKLDNIDYRITRLEVLNQEKSAVDKSDDYISRKLENIEWEMNKHGTLLEVIRQDLDKIQQRQTELKVAISSNAIHSLVSSRSPSSTVGKNVADDSTLLGTATTDIPAKLQAITTQVHHIGKGLDTLQTAVYNIGHNLTDVNNITRTVSKNMQQMMSKQYFNVAMKELLTQHQHPIVTVHAFGQMDKDSGDNILLAHDCAELQQMGNNRSGIFRIKPRGVPEPLFVQCDFETEGGGWTIIQRRLDGSINFYREWLDYKYGFGNVAGEHWLGNENIYHITKQDIYQLRVDLEDYESSKAHATYSAFALGTETDGYMIKLLGDYHGDAGDSLIYHASMKFTTRDVDNDQWEDGNCAQTHTGGWWYKVCDMVNLNGQYLGGEVPESMHYQGVYWYEWRGPEYSLQKVEMKIRPATFEESVAERSD